MSRILVTGMSGTGKSSALAELGQRGYRVVDTDDPGWREYREYVESSDEVRRGEWLWVEERIIGLLDSDDGRSLFVQGCVRNQSKFYDRFNAVVLLSAPADVILDRIARRTTNNYGKTPVEQAMIVDDLARVEPLLRASCTHELDTSRPLDEVVADLIAIASCAVVGDERRRNWKEATRAGPRWLRLNLSDLVASWQVDRLFVDPRTASAEVRKRDRRARNPPFRRKGANPEAQGRCGTVDAGLVARRAKDRLLQRTQADCRRGSRHRQARSTASWAEARLVTE